MNKVFDFVFGGATLLVFCWIFWSCILEDLSWPISLLKTLMGA